MGKVRVILDVNTVHLFDMIKGVGSHDALGDRLVGIMLAEPGFRIHLGLAAYGIDIVSRLPVDGGTEGGTEGAAPDPDVVKLIPSTDNSDLMKFVEAAARVNATWARGIRQALDRIIELEGGDDAIAAAVAKERQRCEAWAQVWAHTEPVDGPHAAMLASAQRHAGTAISVGIASGKHPSE